MKMKRKIVAIWVILLLVTIHVSIVNAGQTQSEQEGTILVQMTAALPDGNLETKTLYMTEEEVTKLQETISLIIDEIELSEDINIETIIDSILGDNYPGLSSILKSIFSSKSLISRAFVISLGSGYRFNPLAHSNLKIRKKITFWFYTYGNPIRGKTIFIKPLILKLKILNGSQIGFMTKFTGIYLSVARNMPQKSFTFFIGTAKNVRGLELSPTIQT